MAVGEDVVGADGLTNRERFEMRREKKRREREARANAAETSRLAAEARERARAEAAAAAAAGEAPPAPAGGMLTSQDLDDLYTESYVDDYGVTRTRKSRAYWDELNKYSGEEKRYQGLLMSGVIDEQGNILKPGGINPTTIMRGEPPSWATPELIKNAYILAFESKARAGQNFMESGDYQNFLDAGYSLTQDQINAIGGVQGQGSQDDLTFGGSQTATGVANPPPPPPPPPPTDEGNTGTGTPNGGTPNGGTTNGGTPNGGTAEEGSEQQLNANFIAFLEALGLGALVEAFRSGTDPDLEGMFGSSGGNNTGGTYTPYVPVMPTPGSGEPVDFSVPTLPINTVGYDPIRGLYDIPNAMTQQTVTEQTGLFNYIYGPQG